MYPVNYAADIQLEDRNRLSTFFRYLFALPAMFVVMLFSIGVMFTVLFAWTAMIFTGRYPQGLYDFHAKFLRLVTRAQGYLNLATDEMPPLNGEPNSGYAIRIEPGPPLEGYSRGKAFFRLLVGIPVMILGYIQQLIAGVISFIAWFAILFTGKMPASLAEPLRSALGYQARSTAYWLLMTEGYPPFSLEAGSDAQLPRGA